MKLKVAITPEQREQEELEKFFRSVARSANRHETIDKWISNPANKVNAAKLKLILERFCPEGASTRIDYVKNWLKSINYKINLSDFQNILVYAGSSKNVLILSNDIKILFYNAIQEWIRTPENNNLANFKAIFPLVEKSINEISFIYDFITKHQQAFSFDEIKEIQALTIEDHCKYRIMEMWFKKDSHTFSLAYVTEILKLYSKDIYSKNVSEQNFQDYKAGILVTWCCKPGNLNLANVQASAKLVGTGFGSYKAIIIENFLAGDKNNCDYNTLIEFLKLIDNNYSKSSIVRSWLKKPGNNFNYNCLKTEILPLCEGDDLVGAAIGIETWQKKPGNRITHNQLPEIMAFLSEEGRHNILGKWLAIPQNNFDYQFLSGIIIPLMGQYAHITVQEWLAKGNNFSSKTLLEVLSSLEKDAEKEVVVEAWLKNPNNRLDVKNKLEIIFMMGSLNNVNFLLAKLNSNIAQISGVMTLDVLKDYVKTSKNDSDTKAEFITAWLDKPGNTIDMDSLQLILKSMAATPLQNSEIVRRCVSNPANKCNYTTLRDKLIPLVDKTSYQIIIQAWMTNPENNLDNLGVAKRILKDSNINVISEWVAKPANKIDFNKLRELCTLAGIGDYSNNRIILAWLQNIEQNNVAIEAFQKIFPAGNVTKDNVAAIALRHVLPFVKDKFYGESEVANVVSTWFATPGRKLAVEDLSAILALGISDEARRDIFTIWLQKNGNNLPFHTLAKCMLPVADERCSTAMITSWLGKCNENNFTYQQLHKILLSVSDVTIHAGIITAWLIKPDNKFTVEQLKNNILPLVSDPFDKEHIIGMWLGKGNNLTIPQLQDIISIFELDGRKAGVIGKWLKTGNNIQINIGALASLPFAGSFINNIWLEDPRTKKDIGALQTILSHITNPATQTQIISRWPFKIGEIVSFEEFLSITKLITDYPTGIKIATDWLNHDGNNFTVVMLEGLLMYNFSRSGEYFVNVETVEAWIAKNHGNIDITTMVAKILPCLSTEDNRYEVIRRCIAASPKTFDLNALQGSLAAVTDTAARDKLVNEWVRINEKSFDIGVLEKIYPHLPNDYMGKVISGWITKDESEEAVYANFVRFLNSHICNFRYNVGHIVQNYNNLHLPKASIPRLCEAFSTSEGSRVSLFNAFVDAKTIKATDIGIIKAFAGMLGKDSNFTNLITNLTDKLNLSPLDILGVSGDRLCNKYNSLSKLFDVELKDCLTKDGLQTATGLMGETAGSLPLSSFLAYYETNHNINGQRHYYGRSSFYDHENIILFTSMVEPQALANRVQNFVPADNQPFVLAGEYKKLESFGGIGLPSMRTLCSYLQGKIPPIPRLDSYAIANYKMNFANCEFIAPEHRQDVQNKFIALLRTNDPSAGAVAEFCTIFYKKAMDLGHVIDREQKYKLLDFFKGNKNEIAHVLSIQGGVDELAHCIHSLGDGCVANISTDFKRSLYKILLKDPCDQILYGVFSELFSYIVNNVGGDHLGWNAHASFFDNDTVTETYISPNGLINKVQKAFCDGDQVIIDPWVFLAERIGENKRQFLYEMLDADGTNHNLSHDAAKMAAFIVIGMTMPALLESRCVRDFYVSCGTNIAILGFSNIATTLCNAVETEAKTKKTSTLLDSVIIAKALYSVCGGDVNRLNNILKVKDEKAAPDSQVMKNNNEIKDLAKELVAKKATPENIEKILSDFVVKQERELLRASGATNRTQKQGSSFGFKGFGK
jgi:hypothetical protein